MGLFNRRSSEAPRRRLQKKTSVLPSANDSSRNSSITAVSTATDTSTVVPPDTWGFDYSTRATTDEQTGERTDVTGMLHSFGVYDGDDDDAVTLVYQDPNRAAGEPMIQSLPPQIWRIIASYLNPAEIACLVFASKSLFRLIGTHPYSMLRHPSNAQYRLSFLLQISDTTPQLLFCFVCKRYHSRIAPGFEAWKTSNTILNPVFECPRVQDLLSRPPRSRVVPGHSLPFTFVQLALRAFNYGPAFGIPVTGLSRRWRTSEGNVSWTHQTRFLVNSKNKHLMMRVTSQSFAKGNLTLAGMRLLLYSREDYTPYFSVCAHWRDGELMDVCKCVLGHIPARPDMTLATEQTKARLRRLDILPSSTQRFASLCGFCQPMRRCPECPSEYLVEAKLAEDKSESNPKERFKQAIVVTRWCDLGDGTNPECSEWASGNGEEVGYDSFERIGRRAVSGWFEGQISDTGPGQRIISMNPKREKRGEEGDRWY